MKKYSLTKITVKTRELISVSQSPATEAMTVNCPVCQKPFDSVPSMPVETALESLEIATDGTEQEGKKT